MIRLEMKSCSTILTKKQQKYQDYHQKKLINMNISLYPLQPAYRQQRCFSKTKFAHVFHDSHLASKRSGIREIEIIDSKNKPEENKPLHIYKPKPYYIIKQQKICKSEPVFLQQPFKITYYELSQVKRQVENEDTEKPNY